MSEVSNGKEVLANVKSSHFTSQSSKNAALETRPTPSGFQSFLRWFKKNEGARNYRAATKNSSYPHEVTNSTENVNNNSTNQSAYSAAITATAAVSAHNRPIRYDSTDTLSPPGSPILGHADAFSSSCDSVFSTATTGFAFVTPNTYRPYESGNQALKLITPSPDSDTYRRRLRQHIRAREFDKRLDLTLRKKYRLYDAETLKSHDLNIREETNTLRPGPSNGPNYADYSLPPIRSHHLGDDSSIESDLNSNYTKKNKRHRRTVSDSSKDKKAGAYVHVKGKRKAPTPPTPPPQAANKDSIRLKVNASPSPSVDVSVNGTLSPGSTLSRKKRRAPPPPATILTKPQTPNEEDTAVQMLDNLMDDKEIKAIIEGTSHHLAEMNRNENQSPFKEDLNPSRHLTDAQKQILIDNIVKVHTPSSSATNIPQILATDTLRLERGMLRPNRSDSHESTESVEIRNEIKNQAAPTSPISPRPWYKRNSSSTTNHSTNSRDSSIPFKKEIVLRTVEKKKGKKNPDEMLPEVGSSRNSSIFDSASKFNFFSRLHDKSDETRRSNRDSAEKRRSGIGIPNISELDREAAEILSKEHACQAAKLAAENEKYFQPTEPTAIDQQNSNNQDMEHAGADIEASPHRRRSSTKDLISKFESTTNVPRVNVNASFMMNRKEQLKTKWLMEGSSSLDESAAARGDRPTSPPVPMTRSYFGSSASPIIQQQQSESQKCVQSDGNTNANAASPQQDAKENENIEKMMWSCPYCTLENPIWRIICEACERIKPYDKRLAAAITTQKEAAAAVNPSAANSNDDVARHEMPPPTVIPTATKRNTEWDKKTEIMLKYFKPKSTGNLLSKSSSETSIMGSKKSPSPNRLGGSPKFLSKLRGSPEKPDLLKIKEMPEKDYDTIKKEVKPPLVESSAVVQTVTPVFIASTVVASNEKPLKEESPVASNERFNMDAIRLARLAKFSEKTIKTDADKKRDSSNESNRTCSESSPMMNEVRRRLPTPPISDEESLEKEKERLREVIRAMNARALAETYPVAKKSESPDRKSNQKADSQSPKLGAIKKTCPTNTKHSGDDSKLGAIKKLFTRRTDSEEKEINENTNSEVQKNVDLKKLDDAPQKIERTKRNKASKSAQTTQFYTPDYENLRNEAAALPTSVEELSDNSTKIKSFHLMRQMDFVDKINSDYANMPVPYSNLNMSSPQLHRREMIHRSNLCFSERDKENVEEISKQLKSAKGLEDFKATLKSSPKPISDTNTLAINKIMRNLENAIADGEHEVAAKLAMDLAKMKVTLSVTKQKHRPNSSIDVINYNITVDMYVEDKTSSKGPLQLAVNPTMTVKELKQKILADYEIPMGVQRWILSDQLASDDKKTLLEYGVIDNKTPLYLYLVAPGLEHPKPRDERVEPVPIRKDIKPVVNQSTNPIPLPPKTLKIMHVKSLIPVATKDEIVKTEIAGPSKDHKMSPILSSKYELINHTKTSKNTPSKTPILSPIQSSIVTTTTATKIPNSSTILSPDSTTFPTLRSPEPKSNNTSILSPTKTSILSPSKTELKEIPTDEAEDLLHTIGAIALPQSANQLQNQGTLKVGWTCPLCTLINSPKLLACVACSETRPNNYVVPTNYKATPVDDFEALEEIKKLLEVEVNNRKAPIASPEKNDLNKMSMTIQSSERLNIKVEEVSTPKSTKSSKESVPQKGAVPKRELIEIKKKEIIPPQPIIMTALVSIKQQAASSPNITKNKYRGVDNFNPKTAYLNGNGGAIAKIPNAVKNASPKPFTAPIVVGEIIKAHRLEKKQHAPQPPVKITEQIRQNASRTDHYLELLNLDNSDAVKNVETFECPICFMNTAPGDGCVLRDCLHSFCRECLAHSVQYSEEAEVKCPYMDAEYSCDSVLQDREVKALVTKEMYDQHLAKSLRVAEHQIVNAFHCKTPNCRGWCIYEADVNQFKCPICKITNCLTCQVIHDGLNCKQYQDQMNSDCDGNVEANRTKDMLKEMVEKGEAMNCPCCQVILMKKWGCDWLKCSMCKTEICWVTRGPRWGPDGKGDTSAGCKCGINGVKCHPKCNYCH